MRFAAVLALGLLASACSVLDDEPKPFTPPTEVQACKKLRVERKVLHGDRQFSLEERKDVELAARDWYDFSSGHVEFIVVWDLDSLRTNEPMVLRVESWMAEVQREDAKENAKLAGYTRSDPDRILLVTDRSRGDLRHLAAHEMGHLADLEWQDCEDTRSVCRHAPDPNALMAAEFSAKPFNASDKLLCRSSCLCP